MGMTNKQFQAFMRFVMSYLKRTLAKYPNDDELKELIDIVQSVLEDS